MSSVKQLTDTELLSDSPIQDHFFKLIALKALNQDLGAMDHLIIVCEFQISQSLGLNVSTIGAL